MPVDLHIYAEAVPVNTLTALGLGPLPAKGATPIERLKRLRSSPEGALTALESIGVLGTRLTIVFAAYDGSLTAEQLAFELAAAAPGVADNLVLRLVSADLASVDKRGTVTLTEPIKSMLRRPMVSLADPDAMSNDALAQMCKLLGLTAQTRKAERIDAIAALFADPTQAKAVVAELSPAAVKLLHRIAVHAGPGSTQATSVGLEYGDVHEADPPRFAVRRAPSNPRAAALSELTGRGIVGVAGWENRVWIWREAWPLVGRPMYATWDIVPNPGPVSLDVSSPPIPACVTALDAALRNWQTNPPKALKNGELRLGKSEIRSTAKGLKLDETMLAVTADLAIGIGLLLVNELGRSGRGRSMRIDQAWLPDAALAMQWASLSSVQRWARLIAEWCSPRLDVGQQLLINRHLVVWELSRLPEGLGYADDDHFAAWVEHRHASIAVDQAVLEVLVDLRALGLVTAKGVGLTNLGRAMLNDPVLVASAPVAGATSAVVQADFTVIAPPDLHPELVGTLDMISTVESTSGALTYRLDRSRIARAVQLGATADELVDFMNSLSSVPVPDTVVRLIRDAGRAARAVRIVTDSTVVVFDDPVDLTTALALSSLKLVKLTDTVAMTEVAPSKIRDALVRKGLAPETMMAKRPAAARSSLDDAQAAERQAQRLRSMASARPNSYFEREAEMLEARAKRLADVTGRLAVNGPLSITVAVVESMIAAT